MYQNKTAQVAQTSAFEVCGSLGRQTRTADLKIGGPRYNQIRVWVSEGMCTRSIRRPQPSSCSAALLPEYSLTLDHGQSCAPLTPL
jgi:hypothetical protein